MVNGLWLWLFFFFFFLFFCKGSFIGGTDNRLLRTDFQVCQVLTNCMLIIMATVVT